MAHILIVEDDIEINELIARNLKLVGHSYLQAFDGLEAVRLVAEHSFDLVLLDLMLPGMDGFEVMRKIAFEPVIFITAKDGLEHKLNGLSLGADDYIVKPFDMLELQTRIETVLRRTNKGDKLFSLGDVKVDLTSREVFYKDEFVDFAPQEFLLIEALVKNRNIALSRDKLLETAWGYDYGGNTRTVDVHIHNIRKKLRWENVIKTVYKLGYRLEVKQ